MEGWRDYIRFVVGVTTPRPIAFDPVDLWSFAVVSIVLDHMATEFLHGHHAAGPLYHLALFLMQSVGMAFAVACMLVGWILSAGYTHMWVRLVGGEAKFTATLDAVLAVLTCSYAVVSLAVLGFMLTASALGVPHAALADNVGMISFAAQVSIVTWLLPMRLGIIHQLAAGQRTVLAMAQLLPLIIVGALLYKVAAFFSIIPGI